jgi:glycosyltransferase involved in cell wall biosynthesis
MKKSRLKIGIIFNFSPLWMGGIIYIINLVKTLNYLDDQDKPEIFLFYRTDLSEFIKEMNYEYLTPIEWQFPNLIVGNIKSLIIRKNIFIEKILKNYNLDVVYPLQDYPVKTKTDVKLISWCADFQHKYFPQFFSKFQITGRNLRTKFALRNSNSLVLSSYDAENDLRKFFKVPETLKLHVYHFVSVIDSFEDCDIESIRLKYNLPEKYFLISNQFHKHKNHKVLLLALSILKDKGIIKHFAITGKFPESGDSPYLAELHKIINENNLSSQIRFLGIIPRNDQLTIMRYCEAVIQPSLFEGWSTVIEDSLSLQVPVIASNLKVNIEQLGKNANFFNPLDANKLALLLTNFEERKHYDISEEEYSKRIKIAALNLFKIFSNP